MEEIRNTKTKSSFRRLLQTNLHSWKLVSNKTVSRHYFKTSTHQLSALFLSK